MIFLIVMVIGLVGLATMAIPAFARHNTNATAAPGHHLPPAHAPSGHHLPAHGPATHPPAAHAPQQASTTEQEIVPGGGAAAASGGLARYIPSPRGVFTVFALFGAFGNVFLDAFHFSPWLSALAAVVPTLVVERFAVRPLWNLVFRFQAQASQSLEYLIMSEAMAVVPFRNGRGIVSTNRDGRIVQLRACLSEDQASEVVKVGDRLRIEDVDARNERVTVSVIKPD